MKDSAFRLQDKTILLTGPFNGITQALLRTLTELGADIGYINEQTPNASKYVEGVNEAREARPDFGRAAYFALPLTTDKQIKEALGRVAEGIGRMDVFIDATPLSWMTGVNVTDALSFSSLLSQQLLPFFEARQRGRIIYLFEDAALATTGVEQFESSYQADLCEHISLSSATLKEKSVTVNGVALGVTEDFILRHFPKSGSIKKSLVELQSRRPGIKLVEHIEVATGMAYLACPTSGSVTGQTLRLTYGL